MVYLFFSQLQFYFIFKLYKIVLVFTKYQNESGFILIYVLKCCAFSYKKSWLVQISSQILILFLLFPDSAALGMVWGWVKW